MSLREKTISGAKWSAIATVIIIGLGLVQMTVLARIIDNHQFGLLTVSLVIIALADTLSDFAGSGNSGGYCSADRCLLGRADQGQGRAPRYRDGSDPL